MIIWLHTPEEKAAVYIIIIFVGMVMIDLPPAVRLSERYSVSV